MNAANTGAQPFKKAITSAPQFKGMEGRTANTVNAIKITPTAKEIILNSYFQICAIISYNFSMYNADRARAKPAYILKLLIKFIKNVMFAQRKIISNLNS